MKFSHSLQFNAVPEWSSKYLAYTTLKKLIYSLQRDSLRRKHLDQNGNDQDLESNHLISNNDYASTSQLEVNGNGESPTTVFTAALHSELKKIDQFFVDQQSLIFSNIDQLIQDIEVFEQEVDETLIGSKTFNKNLKTNNLKHHDESYLTNTTDQDTEFTQAEEEEEEEEEEVEEEEDEDDEIHAARGRQVKRSDSVPIINKSKKQPTLTKTKSIDNYLKFVKSPQVWNELNAVTTNDNNMPPQLILLSESRIILRKRIIGLFTTLSELKSFIELNQTGFKKALKKFDKSLDTNIKDQYLANLPNHSYIFKKSTMEKIDDRLNSLVKLYALICNHGDDLETAKQELSIHLREHVVWERNTVWRDMIGLERKTYAANSKLVDRSITKEKEDSTKKLIHKFNISLTNPVILKLLIIFILTIVLLKFSPFKDPSQKNCFAILICASLLWATEAIPLFVTSLLIPLLIVFLNVCKNENDGSIMNSIDASKYILSTMWNSVILLLLGGFTLAAALSKYQIAKLISTWILSKAGTNPSVVLLTIMSIALFASMWVSNVAAPVLCFSLIQPLLRTLPKKSSFINALILGIALASNIGGMASPIASPQNMIAIGAMDPPPSWLQWFIIALPVCILSLLLIWIFLLVTFNCNSKNTHLVGIRTLDEKFTGIQWYIIFVTLSTILLWCVASKLTGIFGEMGIIALIPIILFFGTGLLSTEDFNNYPWNIVILAMGGTALGKAVASSGLLTTIALTIQSKVEDFSLFGITLIFGFLILVMATFVSHTVAALIVVPLMKEIGNNMEEPHPDLLIMISALICSSAMGLISSGFPNMTAMSISNEFGQPYMSVKIFITRGIPSSIIAYAIIVTIGFATMKIIHF
ncbi:unnamed protein product [Candida verbasci]|uniref:SPX domain-containing protein n=1 Tax=Candida verbasci TaxID=1227364 RepID=A0A9W4XE25_9ASCO|nr:unnamed protein product [Candida verbasci]